MTVHDSFNIETLTKADFQEFATRIRGEVLTPDDQSYDVTRQIWNAMIDKHPAVIVRCAAVADVLNALAFARAHHLEVAVRGGGHNVAGNATCEGGILIDLSQMKSLRIDPIRRTVQAEAGLTWGEF